MMIIVSIFIGIILTIIIFFTISSQIFAPTNNQTLVTYGKDIFGMSIKYPIDWEVKGYNRTQRDDRVGFDLFAILCPKSGLEFPYKGKGYLEDYSQCPNMNEVTISVSNIPKNTTLQEYTSYHSGGKFSFTDYKLEDFGNTTLAGLPAKKMVFSYLGDYKGQDQYIRSLNVITISGNNAYEISYSSPRLEFDDLMPAVQQIIDSLKIFPMPPCNFVRD